MQLFSDRHLIFNWVIAKFLKIALIAFVQIKKYGVPVKENLLHIAGY